MSQLTSAIAGAAQDPTDHDLEKLVESYLRYQSAVGAERATLYEDFQKDYNAAVQKMDDPKSFKVRFAEVVTRARLLTKVERFGERVDRQDEAIKELRAQHGHLKSVPEELDSMSQKQKELESKIAGLERDIRPLPRSWLYPIVTIAVVSFVGALVAFGWTQKPTVAINYNVGEIIGGLLAGLGAMIAGIAYAMRRGEVR